MFGAIRAVSRVAPQLVTTGTLTLAAVSLAAAQDATDGLPYTAITPCRIADTRNMAAGPIKAGGIRVFHGAGPASFTDQGGSATDCGVASLVPAALVVTLTVVSPESAGFASVLPSDSPATTSASLTYVRGAVVTSTVFTGTTADAAMPAANFSLYSHARADYVIELVGYFAPAGERLVSCQESGYTLAWVPPGETTSVTAGACLNGFAATATNCEVSPNARLVHVRNGTCRVRNTSASLAQMSASYSCCRLPSR